MTTKAQAKHRFLPALPILFALVFCQCSSPQQDASGGLKTFGSSDSRYGLGSGDHVARTAESLAVAAKKTSRPGLGTEWGEGRESHVKSTQFTRAGSRPDGTLALRYNDADGAPSQKWSARQPFDVSDVASVGVRSKGRYLKGYSTGSGPIVIGEEGERYSIEVKNRTRQRIEVVLSVDGLDVLDGQSASHGKRGYIIAPRGRLEVEGFRRSFESVAAFRFGGVASSYAARSTGSARNVGVIGAAVFREKGAGDWDIRKGADPFPGERGSGQFATPPGR